MESLLTVINGFRKLEVEKKGSSISIDGALETLGLKMDGNHLPDEKLIRKAYFKLANK